MTRHDSLPDHNKRNFMFPMKRITHRQDQGTWSFFGRFSSSRTRDGEAIKQAHLPEVALFFVQHV